MKNHSINQAVFTEHLFNYVLDKSCSRPGAKAVNKTNKNSCPYGAYSLMGQTEK